MSSDLTITEPERFADFRTMARYQLRTWDVDPMYPLLRRVYEKRGYDREQALWYTALYVNWYWLNSVEPIFQRHPLPERVEDVTYSCRVRKERRCVYERNGEPAMEFMRWMADRAPLTDWVAEITAPGGQAGWERAKAAIEEAPYAGGWVGYKFCDLLRYTHGCEITAPDMGTGAGSAARGPIRSIMELTDLDSFSEVTNAVDTQWAFYDRCQDAGLDFAGLEQCETCLCNYLSTVRRNYYIGSDLDDMMEQLDGAPAVFWEARAELFPPELLGERHGWHGKAQPVRDAYTDDGVLRWWRYGYGDRPAADTLTFRAFPWDDPGYRFAFDDDALHPAPA